MTTEEIKNNILKTSQKTIGIAREKCINNFSEKPQNAAIDLKNSSIGEMSKFTDLTQSSLKIDLKKSVVKVTKITPYSTIILKLE